MSGLNTTNPSAAAGASARGAASAAAAGASVPRQDTLFVSGEGKDSVSVQSQLATATIEGDVTSHSNIGQVVSAREAAEPISRSAVQRWGGFRVDLVWLWLWQRLTRMDVSLLVTLSCR